MKDIYREKFACEQHITLHIQRASPSPPTFSKDKDRIHRSNRMKKTKREKINFKTIQYKQAETYKCIVRCLAYFRQPLYLYASFAYAATKPKLTARIQYANPYNVGAHYTHIYVWGYVECERM